jgi:hypothetical protein
MGDSLTIRDLQSRTSPRVSWRNAAMSIYFAYTVGIKIVFKHPALRAESRVDDPGMSEPGLTSSARLGSAAAPRLLWVLLTSPGCTGSEPSAVPYDPHAGPPRCDPAFYWRPGVGRDAFPTEPVMWTDAVFVEGDAISTIRLLDTTGDPVPVETTWRDLRRYLWESDVRILRPAHTYRLEVTFCDDDTFLSRGVEPMTNQLDLAASRVGLAVPVQGLAGVQLDVDVGPLAFTHGTTTLALDGFFHERERLRIAVQPDAGLMDVQLRGVSESGDATLPTNVSQEIPPSGTLGALEGTWTGAALWIRGSTVIVDELQIEAELDLERLRWVPTHLRLLLPVEVINRWAFPHSPEALMTACRTSCSPCLHTNANCTEAVFRRVLGHE